MVNQDIVCAVGGNAVRFPATLLGLIVLTGAHHQMLDDDIMCLNNNATANQRYSRPRRGLSGDRYERIVDLYGAALKINHTTDLEYDDPVPFGIECAA